MTRIPRIKTRCQACEGTGKMKMSEQASQIYEAPTCRECHGVGYTVTGWYRLESEYDHMSAVTVLNAERGVKRYLSDQEKRKRALDALGYLDSLVNGTPLPEAVERRNKQRLNKRLEELQNLEDTLNGNGKALKKWREERAAEEKAREEAEKRKLAEMGFVEIEGARNILRHVVDGFILYDERLEPLHLNDQDDFLFSGYLDVTDLLYGTWYINEGKNTGKH